MHLKFLDNFDQEQKNCHLQSLIKLIKQDYYICGIKFLFPITNLSSSQSTRVSSNDSLIIDFTYIVE